MTDDAPIDNGTPPAAPAPQPSQPPAPPTPPVYTQAQVDAMLADAKTQAHNAGAAATRRALEGRSTGTSTPAPQPNQPPTPQPAGAGLTAQDIFRVTAFQAAASEYGLTARASEMLLERVMAEKPADVRAWTATEAASFGWPAKSTPTPSPAGSPAPHVAASVPAMPATPTPSGSPPASSAGTYDVKPSQMKPADVAAYVAKNGPKAFSALVRQELAGTRLAPPPRR